jgi:hypothetical protein
MNTRMTVVSAKLASGNAKDLAEYADEALFYNKWLTKDGGYALEVIGLLKPPPPRRFSGL